jgi:hypothetical protein
MATPPWLVVETSNSGVDLSAAHGHGRRGSDCVGKCVGSANWKDVDEDVDIEVGIVDGSSETARWTVDADGRLHG